MAGSRVLMNVISVLMDTEYKLRWLGSHQLCIECRGVAQVRSPDQVTQKISCDQSEESELIVTIYKNNHSHSIDGLINPYDVLERVSGISWSQPHCLTSHSCREQRAASHVLSRWRHRSRSAVTKTRFSSLVLQKPEARLQFRRQKGRPFQISRLLLSYNFSITLKENLDSRWICSCQCHDGPLQDF